LPLRFGVNTQALPMPIITSDVLVVPAGLATAPLTEPIAPHALPNCPVVPLKHTASPSVELAGPVNLPRIVLAQVSRLFKSAMT
jgi:hypothetical protein